MDSSPSSIKLLQTKSFLKVPTQIVNGDVRQVGDTTLSVISHVLFQQKDQHKFMLMLTSYMDETGHSRDEKQKFNGMAGLLCKVEEWELFEARWDKMLKRFGIPYIHMKESRELFDGWSETRLHALSAEAWDKIEKIKPLPLGSIFPMDDFRPLEEKFRFYFDEPLLYRNARLYEGRFRLSNGIFWPWR